MGFSLLLRQTACLGLLLFALGTSCSGSPTSVPDASSPGRYCLCEEQHAWTLPCLLWAWLILIRFCLSVAAADLGSAVSVLDFLHLAFSLFVHRLVQLGSFVSVLGPAQFDLVLFVLDMCTLGSFLSLHGASWPGFPLSVLGFAHVGSLLLLRGGAQLELVLPVPTLSFLAQSCCRRV